MEVIKKETSELTELSLIGVIDENTNFEKTIGKIHSSLDVNCKGIARINSIGVKGWVRYFNGLRKNGIRLRFFECPTAIIQQMELFHNFVDPSEICSLVISRFCKACKKTQDEIFSVADLKKNSFNISSEPCTCGGMLNFDHTDDYFKALKG